MDPYERLQAIDEGIQRMRRLQKATIKRRDKLLSDVETTMDRITKKGDLSRSGEQGAEGDNFYQPTSMDAEDVRASLVRKARNDPRLKSLAIATKRAEQKVRRRDAKLDRKLNPDDYDSDGNKISSMFDTPPGGMKPPTVNDWTDDNDPRELRKKRQQIRYN